MIEIKTKSWKAPKVDQMFMDACAKIDHMPPYTWNKYSDMSDVIKMEYDEMMAAMKNNDMKAYEENLLHLSVALLHEWRELHHDTE